MEAKMEKLGRPRLFACTYDYVLYGLGAHFMDLKIAQISNKDQDLAGYLDLNLVLSNTFLSPFLKVGCKNALSQVKLDATRFN